MKMTITAALLAGFACVPVLAVEAVDGAAIDHARNELWVDTGFATYHFQSDKNLNGRNPGVGLEYRFRDDAAVTAGRFFNSDRQHSRYAGVLYQPWSYHGVRFGAVIGAFDGYPKMHNGGWFLALVPGISWEYERVGINIAVIPTYKERLHGGISAQLKFKLF